MSDNVEKIAIGSRAWFRVKGEFAEAQDGKCAICHRPLDERSALDHSHETMSVRGVLCANCNLKLGWYEMHRSAVDEYLTLASEYAACPRRTQDELLRELWSARHVARA